MKKAFSHIFLICIISQFIFAQPGKTAADTTYYVVSGKKHIVKHYKNGKLNGRAINYYENGKPYYVANYKDDKLEGTETYFFPNGKPSHESFYIDNRRDGPATTYYENGNLRSKGAYKNDRIFGERVYYNSDGKVCNGKFVIYDEKGAVERECECVQGKPEGELKVYKNGSLSMVVTFKGGKPNGLTSYYGSGQKLISTELYENGVFIKEMGKQDNSPPYQYNGTYDLPDKRSLEKLPLDSIIKDPK